MAVRSLLLYYLLVDTSSSHPHTPPLLLPSSFSPPPLPLPLEIVRFYGSVKVGETRSLATLKNECYTDASIFEGAGGYLIAYTKLFLFFSRISSEDAKYLHENTTPSTHGYLQASKYAEDAKTQLSALERHLQSTAKANDNDITFFFSPTVGIYLTAILLYKNLLPSDSQRQVLNDYTLKILAIFPSI